MAVGRSFHARSCCLGCKRPAKNGQSARRPSKRWCRKSWKTSPTLSIEKCLAARLVSGSWRACGHWTRSLSFVIRVVIGGFFWGPDFFWGGKKKGEKKKIFIPRFLWFFKTHRRENTSSPACDDSRKAL